MRSSRQSFSRRARTPDEESAQETLSGGPHPPASTRSKGSTSIDQSCSSGFIADNRQHEGHISQPHTRTDPGHADMPPSNKHVRPRTYLEDVDEAAEDGLREADEATAKADRYLEEVDNYLDSVDQYIENTGPRLSTSRQADHYWSYKRAEQQAHHERRGTVAAIVDDDSIYTDVDREFGQPMSPRTRSVVELPNRDKHRTDRREWTQKDVEDIEDYYPKIRDPKNPARILLPKEITTQRCIFFGLVLCLNLGALLAAVLNQQHSWVLGFILFIKSKDCLSVVVIATSMLYKKLYHLKWPELEVDTQWILSCIPTYSETEEQIVKTIFSLRDNNVQPHKQVMCVIIDGKPRDIRSHLTRTITSFRRPYVTSKFKRGQLMVDAGFMEDVPVIIFEKVKNAGKKDSLILCHDLFNHPRENMPLYSKLLRTEVWHSILPILTYGQRFSRFDMVFCTDADSTIHKGAVKALADGLVRTRNGIAVCGLVLVEFEIGEEWSFWNLYQQFQYTFGQYVRRRAESVWGKVTCLPGCITMISVRAEMAGAIQKYAAPVTVYPVLRHQVQYLGTDRRLTYSMLSQSKGLRTAFIPGAISETVAPLSLQHYLSQRRRWGSNAYFNNMFYCFGEKMVIITRIAALTELVRLTMVYYRLANTIMFLYGLAKSFSFIQILPLLIVSQTPTGWFVINTLFVEPEMRKRWFKLSIGFTINKCIAPLISVTVFTKVATNLGSQVWGMTGGSNAAAAAKEATPVQITTAGDAADPNKSTDATSVVTKNEMPGQVLIVGEDGEVRHGTTVPDLPGEGAVDEEREEKLGGLLP